jgi:hypothetical protein
VEQEAGRLLVTAPLERAEEINAIMAGGGLYASMIRPAESSLEQYFLEVTGGIAA